jgi:putative transposase
VSDHIHKQHNKNLILYHVVCPVRYRRKVITDAVEQTLKNTCLEMQERYEMKFVEIGVEDDHAHFLIQSVPVLSPTQIVRTMKSITAKEIFKLHPEVKKFLWGGSFWTSGYYVNTVGQYANEHVIRQYIKNQGKNEKHYKQLHSAQLTLFSGLL